MSNTQFLFLVSLICLTSASTDQAVAHVFMPESKYITRLIASFITTLVNLILAATITRVFI